MSVVNISSSVDIHAEFAIESDVSSGLVEPHDSLNWLSLECSHDNSDSSSHLVLKSGEGLSSLGKGSNSQGSSVEDEPLSLVSGVVILDVSSEASTLVISPVEGSVTSHSRFDLELDVVTEWVWWELDGLWHLSVNNPSLVSSVMAVPEDNVSVVTVSSSVNIKALASVVLDVSLVASNPVNSLVE